MAAWAAGARRRLEAGTRPHEPLALPGAFGDWHLTEDRAQRVHPTLDRRHVRERSRVIAARFTSSCAGWKRPPTAQEFYVAVRAGAPTDRERDILEAWIMETTPDEIVSAWAEKVYTLRELAAALHRAGVTRGRWTWKLNRWVENPEATGR
ncbi:MAG: hypothetical protein J4F37_11035 [Acidobacteria bacterium]|nr:hypothetical protein [Acidobacteriota bacterium]